MANETILVVEDETLAGLEIQDSLQRAGYHVPEVIDSGDEVMSAVVRHNPQLVIMDIHLNSYTDGIDAAQRMKILGNTPVVYLSAYHDESTIKRAMHTHPRNFLVKPVSSEELCRTVTRAING